MEKNLMRRQREVIKSAYTIINDLEREKSDADVRVAHDKESVEARWKADKEKAKAEWQSSKDTIERNWNRVKHQNEANRSSIRNSTLSIAEALNTVYKGNEWQSNLVGGVPSSIHS